MISHHREAQGISAIYIEHQFGSTSGQIFGKTFNKRRIQFTNSCMVTGWNMVVKWSSPILVTDHKLCISTIFSRIPEWCHSVLYWDFLFFVSTSTIYLMSRSVAICKYMPMMYSCNVNDMNFSMASINYNLTRVCVNGLCINPAKSKYVRRTFGTTTIHINGNDINFVNFAQ